MAEYCTITQLKAYQKITTSVDDTLLSSIIDRASALIDTFCRRTFVAATATRYYQQDALLDDGRLYLDKDLLAVTTLTNGDGTVLPAAAYRLEPRNQTPYHYIALKAGYAWLFDTDGEIVVAGSWGYSTQPPEDIVQAALRTAGYLYALKDSQVFDVTASPEMGIITIPKGLPIDVRQTLESYRRSVG